MTKLIPYLLTLFFVLTSLNAAQAKPSGLIAEWNFDEDQGEVARDSSGNGHDATIMGGAVRTKQASRSALSLDGFDDYVDCGLSKSIGIGGPLTIEAWVFPQRQTSTNANLFGETYRTYLLTYYTNNLCWYVGHRGGPTANWIREKLNLNQWSHIAATYDGQELGLWVNGRLASSRKSVIESYEPLHHFLIGTKGRPDLPKFKGSVDRLRVYNRSLTGQEIVAHFKSEAEQYGFDPTWFRRVKVTPYHYPDHGQVLIEADYRGLQPLQGKGRLSVTLSASTNPDQIVQQITRHDLKSKLGLEEVTLNRHELTEGDYLVRVTLEDDQGAYPVEEIRFSHPHKPAPVPPPAQRVSAPLLPAHKPTAFGFQMNEAGGFTLTIKGNQYAFQSRISWPHGEFNQLTASDQAYEHGETSWRVRVHESAMNTYEVQAGGKFYGIQRQVEVFPTHVYVKDRYTNTSDEDLGLLIYNEMPLKPEQVTGSWLSGREMRGRQDESRTPNYGPSIFFTDSHTGIGVIPIDDVYVIQALPYVGWENAAGMGTEKFALAPGKSYTLEWAIYPTGSGDYYDFINSFRKVEDRIGTIQEAPGFISYGPKNRRQVPTREFIEKRGINIGIISGLAAAADDPQISIQGIEFMDFPKEMDLLRWQVAAIHKKHPGFKVVVHVAHSIYTTNRPEQFSDSRVVGPDGKQVRWGYGYGYIGKDRQEQGWRGWIFYPTPGNSFHDALMRSVNVMMDDLGLDGVFMDGFFAGYVRRWTYDLWDGHSADIDKNTKTIQRKIGSVLLLSQPSMIEFARKIHDKGGIIIGNNTVFTRSIANEKYIIFDNECASGPQLHTAPSVTALRGTSKAALTERTIYFDALDKLSWGSGFLYYNERIPLLYPSLPSKQFPITFQEIRSGLIRGPQRIVTMNSGVYGWPEKPDLHAVYKFDDRGVPVGHESITTVDQNGVRTEIDLQTHESAVIEPIPVTLKTIAATNVRVLQYDNQLLRAIFNGQGEATLNMFVGTNYPDVRDGIFINGGINPVDVGKGTAYRITAGNTTTTLIDRDGTLSVPLQLHGELEILIEPADASR